MVKDKKHNLNLLSNKLKSLQKKLIMVKWLNQMLIEKQYVLDVMVKVVKKSMFVLLVKVKVLLFGQCKWDLECIVKVKVIVKTVKAEVKPLIKNSYVKNVKVINFCKKKKSLKFLLKLVFLIKKKLLLNQKVMNILIILLEIQLLQLLLINILYLLEKKIIFI